MAVKKVILVGEEFCIRRESYADEGITPGHLLERTATGVKKHAGEALNAQPLFAYEREMTGDGIDVAYVADDTVLMAHCPPGTVVWALAGTADVTAFSFVESDGLGRLQDAQTDAATDDTQRASILGVALTAASAGARFKCEII